MLMHCNTEVSLLELHPQPAAFSPRSAAGFLPKLRPDHAEWRDDRKIDCRPFWIQRSWREHFNVLSESLAHSPDVDHHRSRRLLR
jgi:hypothetical protein